MCLSVSIIFYKNVQLDFYILVLQWGIIYHTLVGNMIKALVGFAVEKWKASVRSECQKSFWLVVKFIVGDSRAFLSDAVNLPASHPSFFGFIKNVCRHHYLVDPIAVHIVRDVEDGLFISSNHADKTDSRIVLSFYTNLL